MKIITRSSQHILNDATSFKKGKLDEFFAEYKRVVNCFIDLFWEVDNLPQKINTTHYSQIDSWLLGKAMKCAGNQALQIIKSTRKKDKQKTYSVYKRVFSKAKNKKKKWDLVNEKWATWSKDKHFRRRVNKPVFKEDTITLNADLCHIQDAKKSNEFDLWIRIGSVFGNRFSLILPSRKHSHFNKIQADGFEMKKSIRLFKNKRGNYYVVLTHQKEIDDTPKEGKVVGIDVGVNKLMCCDDGEKYTQLGKEVKDKIKKLQTKKQGSRGYERTCREIKHYIGYSVNQLDWENMSALVMEDLNYTSMMKIKNKEDKYKKKATRKLLGHWNIKLLTDRITNKCEENRVFLTYTNPAYTSQECSRCHEIDSESRQGELFSCTKCGYQIDADDNGATNIRNRLLNHVGSVPSPAEQKHQLLSFTNLG